MPMPVSASAARCGRSAPRNSSETAIAAIPTSAPLSPSSGRMLALSPGTSKRLRHRMSAASRSSETVASSKSRPFARCATADATTTATASCQARRRRFANERESQIRPIPKATVSTRAASGHPGGRTPWTRSTRSAISGVSAETTPITPTIAAPQARSLSALGKRGITSRGYKRLMRESQEPLGVRIPLPRWVTLLLILVAAGLVPWTLYLTFSLPSRHVTSHYDLAWVGFDLALTAAFAATALAAFRGSQWLAPLAAVTGAMLVCDAWFDVVTSQSGSEMWEAIAEAALAELP